MGFELFDAGDTELWISREVLGGLADPRHLKFHFGRFGWCRLEIPTEDEV